MLPAKIKSEYSVHGLYSPIAVGRGPSGPSIEGPFCRTVHHCRTLGDRKTKKKDKKKTENKEKGREIRKKEEKEVINERK